MRFMHGLAEDTKLPAASFDSVTYHFVAHECPAAALTAFVAEARRLLRPGGVLSFVDNNPRSATIQNLPPAIFTLMKSTEPWSDEYYSFDLEAAMTDAGFERVYTVETDHRHRAVFGSVPQA
jgi:ubiquinone/menaquinone biosynthesis C-methylase UbiE